MSLRLEKVNNFKRQQKQKEGRQVLKFRRGRGVKTIISSHKHTHDVHGEKPCALEGKEEKRHFLQGKLLQALKASLKREKKEYSCDKPWLL